MLRLDLADGRAEDDAENARRVADAQAQVARDMAAGAKV